VAIILSSQEQNIDIYSCYSIC